MRVFSDDWAAAWGEALNRSEAYRQAGATWEGSLLLEMTGLAEGAADRCVFLELSRGVCRAARAAGASDRQAADFHIVGEVAAWRRLLDGQRDPIFALMSGALRLERGGLGRLVPQVRAARELVAAAATLSSDFPAAADGGGG